jgi:hypothetical protein
MHVNSATYREMPSCSDCYSVVYTTISPPHMYYISCYSIVHYLHYYSGPTCYGTVHYLHSTTTVTGTAIQYRAKKSVAMVENGTLLCICYNIGMQERKGCRNSAVATWLCSSTSAATATTMMEHLWLSTHYHS